MHSHVVATMIAQDTWACAAVRRVFSDLVYERLRQAMKGLDWQEAAQKFYRQREVYLNEIPEFAFLFSDPSVLNIIQIVETFFGVQVESSFDVAAHQMIEGDFIDVHTDQNDCGETHRLTITMNDTWRLVDGGVLLAMNEGDVRTNFGAWLPTRNNGFLFEICDRSFHAVTPVTGRAPRYSLIFTFRAKKSNGSIDKPPVPFPLLRDLESARSTASHMDIDSASFDGAYEYQFFDRTSMFRDFLSSRLENAPSDWSYRSGNSINVDLDGKQPKGTDAERIDTIRRLKRVPPIIVVRRKSGAYTLVDGSHRLSFAQDFGEGIGVAFFQEH